VQAALDWASPLLARGPVLVYATSAPEVVRAVQARLGVEAAGQLVERSLAAIALGLAEQGVRKLIVAGGETSGAVVSALGVKGLRIGPQIDPGVPWTASLADPPLALALKSGNFGSEDFFIKAWEALP
jgi:3-dehydrotetronate 4-kinase